MKIIKRTPNKMNGENEMIITHIHETSMKPINLKYDKNKPIEIVMSKKPNHIFDCFDITL